ncbi:MAG: hypothetical protein JWR69_3077 [Pedosphaera sp.]|nr:hypothetical protein [Pedosphaera sp.]
MGHAATRPLIYPLDLFSGFSGGADEAQAMIKLHGKGNSHNRNAP